jgi:hypothetical protein
MHSIPYGNENSKVREKPPSKEVTRYFTSVYVMNLFQEFLPLEFLSHIRIFYFVDKSQYLHR